MINLKKEENIYTLFLNNKPVNALSKCLVSELLLLIEEIENDQKTRGLIITTDLENFCAGADLKERAIMTKEESTNKIYLSLNKAKIGIPFPQMDVHLKKK